MIQVARELLGSVFSRSHVRVQAFPFGVLLLAMVLLTTGLVFIAAMDASMSSTGVRQIDFDSHREKVMVAIPIFFAGLFVRPAWLRRYTPLIYLGCLALLVLVLLIGDVRNNAQRWIQLPRFDLQPSELAKIGVILMLARVLHENPLRRFGDWARPFAVAAIPMTFIVLQPDLGTALTMVPLTLGLVYLAGGSGRAIIGLVAGAALLGYTAYDLEWFKGYQAERIDTWVESFEPGELIAARNGPGFHAFHARAFTGNGGLYGRGLGQGIANETGLLPERDCDSIIAVIAEEAGFMGTASLIALYGLMVALLMVAAARLRDRYGRLVVGGVAIYFGAHLVINVSVNLGLLPMTGLTLPLLSTGGSSQLATFLALGLALGLASHHERSLGSDAFREF